MDPLQMVNFTQEESGWIQLSTDRNSREICWRCHSSERRPTQLKFTWPNRTLAAQHFGYEAKVTMVTGSFLFAVYDFYYKIIIIFFSLITSWFTFAAPSSFSFNFDGQSNIDCCSSHASKYTPDDAQCFYS